MSRSEMEALCAKLGIRAECRYGEAPYREDWRDATPWKVTLRLKGRRLTVPFYQGPAHTKEPTAADVLSCLASDASCAEDRTLEEFCSDLGYDSDSGKAEATYQACLKTATKLRRFLGEHYEAVARAEH